MSLFEVRNDSVSRESCVPNEALTETNQTTSCSSLSFSFCLPWMNRRWTGEEIVSGAQRVHVPELLASQAEARGIDVNTISTYMDSFRYDSRNAASSSGTCSREQPLVLTNGDVDETQVRRADARRLRRGPGEGGDALLRPRQHQEGVAFPSRSQEAGAMSRSIMSNCVVEV